MLRLSGSFVGLVALGFSPLVGCSTGYDAAPIDAGRADLGTDAAPFVCTVTELTMATGTIVDEAGEPVTNGLAQFCVRLEDGGAACIMPSPTDTSGVFHVEVPAEVSCVVEGVMRVFTPDGENADTYAHVDVASTPAGEITWTEPFVVYATHAPVSLPEYGDRDVARMVDFGDGLSLEVTPGELPIMRNYSEMRARKVPLVPAPAFLHDTPELLGLYAFRAYDILDTTFAIHIANDTHLAPGTRVGLYVLGGIFTVLANDTQLHEGNFEMYGTATVSEDGSEIVSDEDSGLPFMTWLGYRPLP